MGYTTKSVEERVAEQYPTLTPERSYKIEYVASAMLICSERLAEPHFAIPQKVRRLAVFVGHIFKKIVRRFLNRDPTLTPERSYKIEYVASAMKNDGTTFTDHDVHKILKKKGFSNPNGEWFKCTVKDIFKFKSKRKDFKSDKFCNDLGPIIILDISFCKRLSYGP